MKDKNLWNNIGLRISKNFNISFLYENIGIESIKRTDLYDKGLLDLPLSIDTTADHFFYLFETLFSRIDIYGSMSFDLKRLYAHRYITYWIQFIKYNSIVMVISPVAPHRVFDFSLLIACQMLGINYVSFQTTPIDKQLFLIDKFYDSDQFIFEHDFKSHGLKEKIKNDVARRSGTYEKALPNYEKKNILANKNQIKKTLNFSRKFFQDKYKFWSSFKLPKNLIKGGHIAPFDYASYLICKNRRLKSLKKYYEKNTSSVDVNKEYIFFPLHYQPEETTCPSGGIYSNQLLVLDKLLQIGSQDTLIYVKEHRTQFNNNYNGDLGRKKDFYDFLIQHPRVKLVDMNIDQFLLVDNSKMVATVTGTVAYESFCRNIKSVLFGRTWLNGLTNVHKYSSVSKLQNFYNGNKVYLSVDQKEKEIFQIMKNSFSSVHDENYENLYGRPLKDDEENLFIAIINYIEKKNVL